MLRRIGWISEFALRLWRIPGRCGPRIWGDALAVNDAALLQLEHIEHTGFSRSSGAYGEIEDLARRIGWYLQHGETSSERIALVVPNVSTVQDIIPHVFSRFRIPYFFPAGPSRAVLSMRKSLSGVAGVSGTS